MENLKEQFPIKKNFAYFMTAASGPLPLVTHQKFTEFSQLLLETGSVRFPKWLDIAESTRHSAARLLNVSSDSIAFVKNTGVGLWIASRMIDWQEGDEIIVPAREFPSNIFPWLSLQSCGVKIKWLESQNDHLIPEVSAATIEPLINEKTKLLSVSFVQFDDGSRRNMKELSQLCKKHNLVFVVDAIQGLGALPFDASEIDADFVSAGSQKWLLSPPGVGLLYIKEKWLETLTVPNLGWLSVSDPYNTEIGAFQNSDQRIVSGAKRFEEGTSNFAGVAALGASIDLILEHGIDSISARVENLTDQLVDGLLDLDCTIVSSRDKQKDDWSGIVAFEHPSLDSNSIDKRFLSQKVITTVRNGWVRVAVDFFNDEEEISKLLKTLKRQLG